MDDERISIEAIAGEAKMKEGVFDHHRLILKTDMVSRDFCQLPEDFENVILDSAPIQSLPKGSTGLWFHINTHGMKEESEDDFKEFITDRKGEEQIQNVRRSEADQPEVRYHCNINSLIKSYRNVLNIQNVAFRVFGKVRYTLEMMYVVLICPHKCEELDNEKFPIMRIGEFHDVIRIMKNGDGGSEEGAVRGALGGMDFAGKSNTYWLEWKPYSTRAKSRNIWNHVAFLFYMPSKSQNKSLPLLPPYKYQTVICDKKRLFGNIVEVPGPLLTPPPSPSPSSSENGTFSQLQYEVRQMTEQMRKVEEELRQFRLDTQKQLSHLIKNVKVKVEIESDEDRKKPQVETPTLPTKTQIAELREKSRELARRHFGKEVLRKSCLRRRGGLLKILDKKTMEIIQQDVMKRFSNVVDAKQLCRDAISTYCSDLRKN